MIGHTSRTTREQEMRTKVTFLAGFATGYVLGAKAGRARYEQIRDAARAFASNPAVQSTASSLQHQAGDVLSTAKDKAASSLGATLQEKRPAWLGGQHEPPNGSPAGSNGYLS
jgi:hypothetical protein